MTEPSEGRQQLFEDADLERLDHDGTLVLKAIAKAHRAPTRLEERNATWNQSILDLKTAVVNSPELTNIQIAACLDALNTAAPGMEMSEINAFAADRANEYAVAHEILSTPGELVMQHKTPHRSEDPPFVVDGNGLSLVVYDRDEGYPHGFSTGTIDKDGEPLGDIALDSAAIRSLVSDPDTARGLPELTYVQGLHDPKLIVGEYAVAALLGAEPKYSKIFPFYRWQQARHLGFKLEELDSGLKELYDATRQHKLQGLAVDLTTSEIQWSKQSTRTTRRNFETAQLFGITEAEIRQEIESILSERSAAIRIRLALMTAPEQEPEPSET